MGFVPKGMDSAMSEEKGQLPWECCLPAWPVMAEAAKPWSQPLFSVLQEISHLISSF